MSAIAPQTEIIICHNIPLSKDYAHTILFSGTTVNGRWVDGRTIQNNYFMSHAKVRIPHSTYQRVNSRQIKVRGNAQSYEDCNYLMFQNPYISVAGANADGTEFVPSTATKYKWFYAFIDSVEYINNGVTLITYTIDVMQTYMFDWKFKECYVDREHTTEDSINVNTTQETVDTGGEYVLSNTHFQSFENYNDNGGEVVYPDGGPLGAFLIATTEPPMNTSGGEKPFPSIINGVLTNMYYEMTRGGYMNDDASSAFKSSLMQYITNGYEDCIVALGTYPAFACVVGADYGVGDGIKTGYNDTINVQLDSLFEDGGNTLNGVRVYNKKLFQSPYNVIVVSNNLGSTTIWQPELFTGNRSATMYGCVVPTPTVLLTPNNYRNRETDWENGVIFNDFPLLAWGGDAYKAWYAQNKGTISATKSNAELAYNTSGNNAYMTQWASDLSAEMSGLIGIFNGVGEFVGGLQTYNYGKGISGGVNAIGSGAMISVNTDVNRVNYENAIRSANSTYTQTINSLKGTISNAKAIPDKAMSLMTGDSVALSTNRFGYTIMQMTIKPEFIKKVDEYFSRFGYSVKKLKIPNICARKFYTFVKTIDCNVVPCYEGGFKNANGSLSNVGYGLSANVVTQINNIFNNGITFWRYNQEEIPNWQDNHEVYARDTFCNYSLLNSEEHQNSILDESLRIVNPSDEYVPLTM